MEKKNWKINTLDVIILCIVLIGIVFVAIRTFDLDALPDEPDTRGTYQVTFFAECVPEAVADYLNTGDCGVNSARNMDLGTLTDYSVSEAIVYVTDSQGNFLKATKEDYCSVSLTFTLKAEQESTGLLVGDYHLNVGYYINIFVGNAYLSTYITAITPVEIAQ